MRTRRKQKLSTREVSTVDPNDVYESVVGVVALDPNVDSDVASALFPTPTSSDTRNVSEEDTKRNLFKSEDELCLLCVNPVDTTELNVPTNGQDRWSNLVQTLSDIFMVPVQYLAKLSEFWLCPSCVDQIVSVQILLENIKDLELRIAGLKNGISRKLSAEDPEVHALSSRWANLPDILGFREGIRRAQNRILETVQTVESPKSEPDPIQVNDVHQEENPNFSGVDFNTIPPDLPKSVNDCQPEHDFDEGVIALEDGVQSFHIDHEEVLMPASEVELHVSERKKQFFCDFLSSNSGKCSLALNDESKTKAHRRSHRLCVNLVDFASPQLKGSVSVPCPHPACGGKAIWKQYFEKHTFERHKKYVCLHPISNEPEAKCLQLFDSRDLLEEHRNSHIQARCVVPFCEQDTVSLPLFKDHVFHQHQLHACSLKNDDESVCPHVFEKLEDVDRHKKYDHDYAEGPSRTVLEVTNPDLENGRFNCDVCGSKYIPVAEFATHVRCHGYFVCMESNVVDRDCLSYFSTKVALATHLESEHKKDGYLSYESKLVPWKFKKPLGFCQVCGKSGLFAMDGFREHMKEHGFLICDGEDLTTGIKCIKYFRSTHQLYIHRLGCKLVEIDAPTGRMYSDYQSSLYCQYCKELIYFDRRETWNDHMQAHKAIVCDCVDPSTQQRCYRTELSSLLMKYHQEAKHSELDLDDASLCSEMSDDDSEKIPVMRLESVNAIDSDGDRVFCKFCGIEFQKFDKIWEEHIQSHGGLICDVFIPDRNELCRRSFDSITTFASHCQKEHTKAKSATAPVKCKKCCYAAQTTEKLKQHRKKHQIRKPAMCEHCGRSFYDMQNLKDHMVLAHEDKDKLHYFCSICNQGFKLRAHLRYHRNVVHDDKRITCEVCGRIYSYQNFKRHADKHVEAKLKCPVSECGKVYATPLDLRVHVKRSHGERKFACKSCPWTFQTSMALKRHEIGVHENARPYKCDICGASVKTSGHLSKHKKRHEEGLLPRNAAVRILERKWKPPPSSAAQ